MIDPVKILKRSWTILWSYRALWVFGLILALAAGGASSNSSNSNYRNQNNGSYQPIVGTASGLCSTSLETNTTTITKF